jgi:hypothetical protein
MGSFDIARWPLLAVGVGGVFLGVLPALWVLRRVGRRLLGRPQPPAGLGRHFVALATSAALVGVGLGALSLLFALQTWRAFTDRELVAEVQCIELEQGKLRLYYSPVDAHGVHGAAREYDLAGDQWTVAGDVLRFRPWLTVLGLHTVHRVSRVEGRWTRAADANMHPATAHDVDGGTSAAWLGLYRDGTSGPLGWLVDGVHGQAVSQLPDRRAAFDVYITPDGYVLNKRSL